MNQPKRSMANTSTDENDPFSDGAILPSQFFKPSSRATQTGIQRLLLAVLDDGIQSYLGGRRRRERRDAEEWIFLSNAKGLFSFDTVCDALDLDADSMRRALYNRKTALHSTRESELPQQEQLAIAPPDTEP